MPERLAIAVLISGSGTNLQAIIDNIAARQIPCDIRLVLSNKASAYGLERARNAGIPTCVLDHRKYSEREDFDRDMHDRIEASGANFVVLAGFMRILSTWFVSRYENRMINIHPALLPEFKGLDTHTRVIESGNPRHGATVHIVIPELDDGPNLLQGRIKIRPGESAEDLQQRVHRVEHRIYPAVIEWLSQGRLELANDGPWLDNEKLNESGEIIDYEDI